MFNLLAADPKKSKGRLYKEDNEETNRTPFERDRDRIIHSNSFRKLKHKTQVFIESDSDYYRTRLTHSLEVSQIARSLCRAMHLNEDLGEVVSLAHDLGHPPFGHNGEKSLNNSMHEFGGFNHNDQTLRVLTHIEKRHPSGEIIFIGDGIENGGNDYPLAHLMDNLEGCDWYHTKGWKETQKILKELND